MGWAEAGSSVSAQGYPSSGDLERNFDQDYDDSQVYDDASGGRWDERDVGEEGMDEEEGEDEGDDLDADEPLYPGIYRAMFGFEPEGTAEVGLREDELVRVVKRCVPLPFRSFPCFSLLSFIPLSFSFPAMCFKLESWTRRMKLTFWRRCRGGGVGWAVVEVGWVPPAGLVEELRASGELDSDAPLHLDHSSSDPSSTHEGVLGLGGGGGGTGGGGGGVVVDLPDGRTIRQGLVPESYLEPVRLDGWVDCGEV